MPLCTTPDVEALLQIDIVPDNQPMIVALIEQAGAVIAAEVGRDLEAAAYTGVAVPVKPGAVRGVILTPHWPLASVDKVTEAGVELTAGTDYREDLELGALTRLTSAGTLGAWSTATEAVLVDYTTETPPAARAECARLAARAFAAGAGFANRPDELLGVKQLTIGRWSATAESGPGSRPGIELDPISSRVLASLRDRRP